MIPRLIHQIWIGPNKIPEKYKNYAEQIRKSHPNWEYKLWTNDDLKKCDFQYSYLTNEVIENWMTKWEQVEYLPYAISEIFRFHILNRHGGIYTDIDSMIVKSFEYILNKLNIDTIFTAGMRPANFGRDQNPFNMIDITIMGATKNNRILNEILDIDHRCTPSEWPWPHLLFELIDTDVQIFNHKYFFDEKVTKDTIILHEPHRLHSWKRQKTKQTQNEPYTSISKII